MDLTSIVIYKGCRIHASRLVSGMYVASIVAPGATVAHVPGQFESREQAVQAAWQHVDQLLPEQDRGG